MIIFVSTICVNKESYFYVALPNVGPKTTSATKCDYLRMVIRMYSTRKRKLPPLDYLCTTSQKLH
jgi:hypothetical protein